MNEKEKEPRMRETVKIICEERIIILHIDGSNELQMQATIHKVR